MTRGRLRVVVRKGEGEPISREWRAGVRAFLADVGHVPGLRRDDRRDPDARRDVEVGARSPSGSSADTTTRRRVRRDDGARSSARDVLCLPNGVVATWGRAR